MIANSRPAWAILVRGPNYITTQLQNHEAHLAESIYTDSLVLFPCWKRNGTGRRRCAGKQRAGCNGVADVLTENPRVGAQMLAGGRCLDKSEIPLIDVCVFLAVMFCCFLQRLPRICKCVVLVVRS